MEKKIVEVTLNDSVDILLSGKVQGEENDTEDQRPLRLEEDATLRVHSLTVGENAAGEERPAAVEDDRTPRAQQVLWETATPGPIRWRGEDAEGEATVSLYGTNVSGNIQGIENEDTGELRVVGLGADEAGNLDRLRTDPDRVPWQRTNEGYVWETPKLVPAAEGILYNPAWPAAYLFEVRYKLVNFNPAGVFVTASIGVDLAGGGGLAAHEYYMFNEIIPYPGSSGWRGPYLMRGTDDIRGIASVVNALGIHFLIRRVDLGA